MDFTPEQRIKRQILQEAIAQNEDLKWEGEITPENVDKTWSTVLIENDAPLGLCQRIPRKRGRNGY